MTQENKVAVIGGGAWGTALAQVFSLKTNVIVYEHDEIAVNSINKKHENEVYLKGYSLNQNIQATNNLQSVADCNIIVIAVPSHFVHEICAKLKNIINPSASILICSKGFSSNGELLSVVVERELPNNNYGVLVGPSFAVDTVRLKPTSLVLASTGLNCVELAEFLSSNALRIYYSTDVIGVQVGSSVKNILAIAGGVCEGAGYGDNAFAAMITRGINEMLAITKLLNGEEKTIYGLSGIGDLILTSSSPKSRNFSLGYEIGKIGHYSPDIVSRAISGVKEGVRGTKMVKTLASKNNISLPIVEEVYSILYEEKSVEKSLNALMTRPIKEE